MTINLNLVFIVEVHWLKSVCWTWLGFHLLSSEMFYFVLAILILVHVTKEAIDGYGLLKGIFVW